MGKGSIDYDYDEVISYIPGTPCTAVNDLATNLNTLGNNLDNMQEQFHSTNLQQVVGKVYTGFSNIIGDSTKGLAKLDQEAAKVLNVCYNEAMNDKKIVENGTGGDSSKDEGTSNMQTGTEKPSTATQSEKNQAISKKLAELGWTGERNEVGLKLYNEMLKEFGDENIAIAMLANTMHESSLYPGCVEGAPFGTTVNANNIDSTSAGVGMVQWTSANRKAEIISRYKEAAASNPNFYNDTQAVADVDIQYMVYELKHDYSFVIDKCKGKSIDECTSIIRDNYEVGTEGNRHKYATALEGIL